MQHVLEQLANVIYPKKNVIYPKKKKKTLPI